MPMTLVVTSNVAPRFRGFLASVMLEIAPGVYTSPRMSKAIRERVWTVLDNWYDEIHESSANADAITSIIMTWQNKNAVGGQSILTKGIPKKELVKVDGILLVKRETLNSGTT